MKKIAICFGIFVACSGCVSREQLVRYERLRARDAELTQMEINAVQKSNELHRRYCEMVNKEPFSWYQAGSDLYDSLQWLRNL